MLGEILMGTQILNGLLGAGNALFGKGPQKTVGQGAGMPAQAVQPTQFAIPQVSSQDIAQLMQLLSQTRQQAAPAMPGMPSMKPPVRSLW